MGKLLLLLACLCLAILIFGTAAAPDNSAFWLASSTTYFEQIRGLLLFVLLVQLVTNPPRHIIFRLACGALAAAVGSWALQATYGARIELLDSLSLLAAASAIGVTALEVHPSQPRWISRIVKRAVTA